jgi:hypothetical protein
MAPKAFIQLGKTSIEPMEEDTLTNACGQPVQRLPAEEGRRGTPQGQKAKAGCFARLCRFERTRVTR